MHTLSMRGSSEEFVEPAIINGINAAEYSDAR
jgi:hypothetical protein